MAMTLIGILLLSAYPSFQALIIKSRRSDAHNALLEARTLFEHCFANHYSYLAPCNLLPHFPYRSKNGYYSVNLADLDLSHYTLIAIPHGSQKKDTRCMRFSINQANQKTAQDATGQDQPLCWSHT